MFVIGLFYPMFYVRDYSRSLLIKSDILIGIQLYNNLFRNETFLLLMYQNYLKYNICAMTISENLIMTMICGYKIMIGKFYQSCFLLMDTLEF